MEFRQVAGRTRPDRQISPSLAHIFFSKEPCWPFPPLFSPGLPTQADARVRIELCLLTGKMARVQALQRGPIFIIHLAPPPISDDTFPL